MSKFSLLILALSTMGLGQPLVADEFKHPLRDIRFNPSMEQREFERSTLNALDIYDPWERWNRHVYHFNYRADQWIMLPVVRTYHKITPRFIRSGVRNFFSNFADVPNLANSLLQLKGKRSLNTGTRLLLNTTLGIGGLWDPATRMGIPQQNEDFGQTLGFYGVPAGPYMMLPILGPSSLRDASGLLVDFAVEQQVNLVNYATASANHPELTVLRVINQRANTPMSYGQLNSPFEYEKIRYVYSEARKLQIND